MKTIKVDYIHPEDFGNDWNFGASKHDYERLSNILNYIKKKRLINSLKEFAESIEETSVGLNDLKTGRKKISVKHILSINEKYPYINTDYVLLNEGLPFEDVYLIKKINDANSSTIELNLKLIKDPKSIEIIISVNPDYINSTKYVGSQTGVDRPKYDSNTFNEIMNLKNQLLEAKNEIIRLKDKIYELTIKNKKR